MPTSGYQSDHRPAITGRGDGAEPFVPPEMPGDMPTQSLLQCQRDGQVPRRRWSWALSGARRGLVLGGALALAALTINEMRLVLKVGGLTLLEMVVLALFAVNTVWICLPSTTALAGFLRLLLRWGPRSRQPTSLAARTAIVMPLYNEDAVQVGATLDAILQDLQSLGHASSFDVFILSDSNDGDRVLLEHEMVRALRGRKPDGTHIYYRRRRRNTGHKSGNIHEFCTRWGRAYDYLLILDADSLMEAATIVELVRRMEADPTVGLIQTVPQLIQAKTLVARVQQFASAVYGPVLAAGLAFWTGREGNFWGHNAIIRRQAFMASAGLPSLPGGPPLGGPILSHDFVEAALLRRAGWGVVIADDLQGSYESGPSSLIDLSIRDRRWCQGNLQHLRLITAKGLHWVSRLHLATGIFSYLSSPMWLLFLIVTLALGVQNEFAKPEYFTRSYTLFPIWPHLDPVRALRLFGVTLAILLAPKALGIVQFALRPRRLLAAGGLRFPVSIVLELLISALLAPVMMLIHFGFVTEILRGKDSGWKPQRRGEERLPWSEIAYRHRWHMAMGLGLVAAGRFISWKMLAWLIPAIAGMLASIPMSIVTGSSLVGSWFIWLGLLRSPAEAAPPAIRRKLEEALPFYAAIARQTPTLLDIVRDTGLLRRHLALVDQKEDPVEGPVDVVAATAVFKVNAAGDLEEVVARLNAQERAYVQSAPQLLRQLSQLPRRLSPDQGAESPDTVEPAGLPDKESVGAGPGATGRSPS